MGAVLALFLEGHLTAPTKASFPKALALVQGSEPHISPKVRAFLQDKPYSVDAARRDVRSIGQMGRERQLTI
jgi:hypothetical protein